MNQPNILLVTKGHPFDKNAFFSIFDNISVSYTHVEQPAAQLFYSPQTAAPYDAIVAYDMPGIGFGPGGPAYPVPDAEFQSQFKALLEQGKGMVFLHHAIAGWPAWEEYAEILGGRFLYTPASLRNKPRQDSGYRHKTTHNIRVNRDNPMTHPITDGLPDSFPMTDELYLYEVFDDSVIPLLTSDYGFVEENFYSASKAVIEGRMFDNDGWQHQPGSNLVGWVKSWGNSPIVYIQGGDDPEAYSNSHYQTLIENAINWVSSPEAHAWAARSSGQAQEQR